MWTYGDSRAAVRDVLRLSRAMTFKAAVAGLPLGGGKGVIMLPAGHPPPTGDDRRDVLLDFGGTVAALDGAYITAEDVGTSDRDMAVIAEATDNVAGLAVETRQLGRPEPVDRARRPVRDGGRLRAGLRQRVARRAEGRGHRPRPRRRQARPAAARRRRLARGRRPRRGQARARGRARRHLDRPRLRAGRRGRRARAVRARRRVRRRHRARPALPRDRRRGQQPARRRRDRGAARRPRHRLGARLRRQRRRHHQHLGRARGRRATTRRAPRSACAASATPPARCSTTPTRPAPPRSPRRWRSRAGGSPRPAPRRA